MHGLKQPGMRFARNSVGPGTNQQLHVGTPPLGIEHLEKVALPVVHRNHTRPPTDLAYSLRHVIEPLQPASRPAMGLGRLGTPLPWTSGQQTRTPDQTRRQTIITQGDTSNLVLGPLRCNRTYARLQHRRMVNNGPAKLATPGALHLVDEDRLFSQFNTPSAIKALFGKAIHTERPVKRREQIP